MPESLKKSYVSSIEIEIISTLGLQNVCKVYIPGFTFDI